eukprot:4608533-Amphidinium_carterae.1
MQRFEENVLAELGVLLSRHGWRGMADAKSADPKKPRVASELRLSQSYCVSCHRLSCPILSRDWQHLWTSSIQPELRVNRITSKTLG